MAVLNTQKIRSVFHDIPPVPDKLGVKRARPREIAVVIEPNCTGCEVCIPFCPVACIEVAPAERYPDRPIPPVRVRYDECIGCRICMRVCERLAWDAYEMVPTDEVERRFGIAIHDRKPMPASPE
jgi:Pyruvate/2-oxoacid:ferredoxin oxidoreductase delta subunit